MRTGTSVSLRLAQFQFQPVLGPLSTGSVLRAQVGTPGTFIGTVRDATNSSVSGAKVTAMNLATARDEHQLRATRDCTESPSCLQVITAWKSP